jgi:hypothetical protein
MIGDGVVLLHPGGVEAELFGTGHFRQRLLVIVATLDGNEAELQSSHGPSFPLAERSFRRI